jgi:hypothetical protein
MNTNDEEQVAEEIMAKHRQQKQGEKKEGDKKTVAQAEILTKAARSGTTLFHTPAPECESYADIMTGAHRETHRVRSQGFRAWLRHQYWIAMKKGCTGEALQQAVETIAAWAQFEGDEREVHCRIADYQGAIYIDLGDADWRVVKISKSGWQILDDPPVRFRRSPSTRTLPIPQRGGSVQLLRDFVNVQSDSEFVLLVGYIVAVLRPNAAYPVLVITGEHGTCKSTCINLIVRLTDPRSPEQRSLPRNEDDVITAAKGAHVLPFDNIARLPNWLSDAFCRLSTGGGAGKRKLYTDDDEILFAGRRPVIINGIEDVATRADLVDRAVMLALEPIAESKRRKDEELNADFAAKAPLILGALLDGLVAGLGNREGIEIKDKPRMADFASWAEACTRAYWPVGTFIKAYRDSLSSSVGLIIEGSTVGTAVQSFMAGRTKWQGTASELLPLLCAAVGEVASREQGWPRRANALSGKLRRVTQALRKTGIHVTMTREGHNRVRIITIETRTAPEDKPETSSASFRPSAEQRDPSAVNDLGEFAADEVQAAEDDAQTMVGAGIGRDNPLENSDKDDADTADDVLPLSSGGPESDMEIEDLSGDDLEISGSGRSITESPEDRHGPEELSHRAISHLARQVEDWASNQHRHIDQDELEIEIERRLAGYVKLDAISIEVERVMRAIFPLAPKQPVTCATAGSAF